MRSEIVTQWISQTRWRTWNRTAMTGDASARRYERLNTSDGTSSVILMDAAPDLCGSQFPFVKIAEHLRTLSLAAPHILEWDEKLGLMVLEDLGRTDFAKHLRTHPTDEVTLYEKAAETLLAIQSASPPDGLVSMTPDVGTDMIDMAFEWAATDQSGDLWADVKSNLKALLTQIDPDPRTLSLRDFHAENLIWRPEQNGLNQIGLLDFQDAFVTHPMYDLASLLRDARRDVDPNLLDHLLPRFLGGTKDAATMKEAFHVIATQRNLRILGIFHRLSKQDGKDIYLSLIPRVLHHLKTDLATPICAPVAPLISRAFKGLDI